MNIEFCRWIHFGLSQRLAVQLSDLPNNLPTSSPPTPIHTLPGFSPKLQSKSCPEVYHDKRPSQKPMGLRQGI